MFWLNRSKNKIFVSGSLKGVIKVENKKILPCSEVENRKENILKEQKPAYEWESFKLNSDGHVTVVVQDDESDQVLMVAYMNQEAYEMTVKTGKMTYYSRSRDELWIKGATSGHYQYVKSLVADCDMDTILARVSQVDAACHTGSFSCFFNKIM